MRKAETERSQTLVENDPEKQFPEPKPEEVLLFQPEWCRVAFSSICDAVIITDTEGRITFLNPVAESLTGWTQKQAAGASLESVFKIVSQETRKAVESPSARALRDGVIIGLANHTLLIAKDGTECAIEDSASPICNDRKEVAGAVLVFRDASERMRQESHLQDALIFADNIIATMREPFVVLDKRLRIKMANRSFYRQFQVSQEETEGHHIYELGNGQWNIPRLRTLLEEVLLQNHSFQNFDIEHDFPVIGKRIMLLNATRFEAVNSQSELILLAIEDITERKRMEVAVQTSEVCYRRLFETAQDGILILDADTLKIIDANPFMTELLGYTHDEFGGKELWEIGLFGDRQASQATNQELQAKGYIHYDHLSLETKHGEKAEVEFVSNIYQVNDRTVAQCNIRDISERSRLEQRLKEQSEALADLDRRKDEFLAMLSHELRSPLAPISNAVDVLRLRKNEDPLQQRTCIILERQLAKLTHLVDDLMDVSRITTGRIRLQRERVTLNGIVENGVETVRTLISHRQHQLTVSLPPEPIWVYADASRLEQVVVNLLTNAAKYTEEGGQIWLSIQAEEEDCVLTVRDTGVGIAPELLLRIFDLFTQAERSLDRSQGGLGIGLSLVHRLVELHGGTVAAHSRLGEGSEFVVRLPRVQTAELPPSPAETTKLSGPSLRVMVVDDNIDTADFLVTLLEASGHDVRMAHDGPSSLKAALAFQPDVVLLDIGLPGLDGFEVAKRLRQQTALNGIVLVAMTGYGQESDRQRSLDAGFNHHLVKPTAFSKVQQILATVSQKAT
jgi:PAS domain S-box-containing protein